MATESERIVENNDANCADLGFPAPSSFATRVEAAIDIPSGNCEYPSTTHRRCLVFSFLKKRRKSILTLYNSDTILFSIAVEATAVVLLGSHTQNKMESSKAHHSKQIIEADGIASPKNSGHCTFFFGGGGGGGGKKKKGKITIG